MNKFDIWTPPDENNATSTNNYGIFTIKDDTFIIKEDT